MVVKENKKTKVDAKRIHALREQRQTTQFNFAERRSYFSAEKNKTGKECAVCLREFG